MVNFKKVMLASASGGPSAFMISWYPDNKGNSTNQTMGITADDDQIYVSSRVGSGSGGGSVNCYNAFDYDGNLQWMKYSQSANTNHRETYWGSAMDTDGTDLYTIDLRYYNAFRHPILKMSCSNGSYGAESRQWQYGGSNGEVTLLGSYACGAGGVSDVYLGTVEKANFSSFTNNRLYYGSGYSWVGKVMGRTLMQAPDDANACYYSYLASYSYGQPGSPSPYLMRYSMPWTGDNSLSGRWQQGYYDPGYNQMACLGSAVESTNKVWLSGVMGNWNSTRGCAFVRYTTGGTDDKVYNIKEVASPAHAVLAATVINGVYGGFDLDGDDNLYCLFAKSNQQAYYLMKIDAATDSLAWALLIENKPNSGSTDYMGGSYLKCLSDGTVVFGLTANNSNASSENDHVLPTLFKLPQDGSITGQLNTTTHYVEITDITSSLTLDTHSSVSASYWSSFSSSLSYNFSTGSYTADSSTAMNNFTNNNLTTVSL
jgi:hypothetical protein